MLNENEQCSNPTSIKVPEELTVVNESLCRNRLLTKPGDVFAHNAWDDVVWDEEMVDSAEKSIQQNSSVKMDPELARTLLEKPSKNWESFYDVHENKFFKDRNWLLKEFPELDGNVPGKSFRVLETGCGVGNTVFPLLQYIDAKRDYFVYGCDFSQSAITLTHQNHLYDLNRCKTFVWDLTELNSPNVPFDYESLDVVVMVFVLSAIHPKHFKPVILNLCKFLKPGGVLLFRDYGRYDLAQLRFKQGRCIEDNFYSRGDGTQVYFFTQSELDELFVSCGLTKEQNLVDRRLQVNRGKQIKMYRVWIQCKYRKC